MTTTTKTTFPQDSNYNAIEGNVKDVISKFKTFKADKSDSNLDALEKSIKELEEKVFPPKANI